MPLSSFITIQAGYWGFPVLMTVVEVSVCQTASVTGAFVMSRALQRTHFCTTLLLSFCLTESEMGNTCFIYPTGELSGTLSFTKHW